MVLQYVSLLNLRIRRFCKICITSTAY